MPARSITFPGARDQKLAGRLELPTDGEPRACAILAHCFTCSSDILAATYLSRALMERQIAVLRFDFTGIGESEGELADSSFSADVDDIVAAGAFLERELVAPTLLVGHSLGGAAVIAAASRLPTVRAVSTIGAPADMAHIQGLIASEIADIERLGRADVQIAGRRFSVSREFVDDLERTRMRDHLREMEAALLLFHDPQDDVVNIDNATRLYTAARHPKSFISLPGAGHMLASQADAEYVGSVLAAWAERYLPTVQEEAVAQRPTRVTTSTGREGFRTEIGVRAHTLLADEPVSVGGTDAGPTPYDLLAAALGACTTMTLQMYARRKGWPLRRAIARLRHSRVYAEDQKKCVDEPARLDRLDREIELVGDLTDEQRQRLLEIADRCPVHLTLDAGVAVHTSLTAASGATAPADASPAPAGGAGEDDDASGASVG